MSPATTKETDSRFNIVLIGHVDAGKTTLAAALTKASGTAVPYSKIKAAPEEKTGGLKGAKVSRVDFESDKRLYTLFDCPAHEDHEKLLKSGQVPIHGAVLVVSALDGVMPQTRDHVSLCRKISVPTIDVFISKADTVDDPEMKDLVETEVRELLSECDYPGDSVTVVAGSGLQALQSSGPDPKILEIVKMLDSWDSSA